MTMLWVAVFLPSSPLDSWRLLPVGSNILYLSCCHCMPCLHVPMWIGSTQHFHPCGRLFKASSYTATPRSHQTHGTIPVSSTSKPSWSKARPKARCGNKTSHSGSLQRDILSAGSIYQCDNSCCSLAPKSAAWGENLTHRCKYIHCSFI